MEQQQKRHGDRWDGTLLRDLDGLHVITPMIYPGRCDNEAYMSINVELAPIQDWLDAQNALPENQDFKYTFFHVIVAAFMKALTLRPKMNRFIANKNTYQRNHVSGSFVVKKQFNDESEEGLAIIYAEEDDNVFTLHEKLKKQIFGCRSEKKDKSSDAMDAFNKLPRWLCKFLVWLVCRLEKKGLCPRSLIASDPYYASVIFSNLGSIKLKSGYHHLTEWGTTSVFCIVGEKKMRPVFHADGHYEMRESLDLGITLDERIADGYYYSQTARLLKHLLAHPELLEAPLKEDVDYANK